MLVSKHGFDDMMLPAVSLDPSRVAAQVVSDDVRHVRFMVVGTAHVGDLAGAIEDLDGVLQIRAVDANADVE